MDEGGCMWADGRKANVEVQYPSVMRCSLGRVCLFCLPCGEFGEGGERGRVREQAILLKLLLNNLSPRGLLGYIRFGVFL